MNLHAPQTPPPAARARAPRRGATTIVTKIRGRCGAASDGRRPAAARCAQYCIYHIYNSTSGGVQPKTPQTTGQSFVGCIASPGHVFSGEFNSPDRANGRHTLGAEPPDTPSALSLPTPSALSLHLPGGILFGTARPNFSARLRGAGTFGHIFPRPGKIWPKARKCGRGASGGLRPP